MTAATDERGQLLSAGFLDWTANLFLRVSGFLLFGHFGDGFVSLFTEVLQLSDYDRIR